MSRVQKTEPGEYAENMTIREYFAALAMQGYMSCEDPSENELKCMAITSVAMADALIAALNEESEG